MTIALLIAINNAIAQNNYDAYIKYKNKKEQNLDVKGDSLISLSINKNEFHQAAKIAHDLSIYFYRKDIYKSIKYGKLEVENLEVIKKINNEYINGLYNLGRFFYKNNEYDKAIFYYKKVVKLNFKKTKVAKSYSEIGKCYGQKGLFFEAIRYLKIGISFMEKRPYTESLIVQYLNIAEVYREIGDESSLNKSVLILTKADSISKSRTVKPINKFQIYNILASLYSYKANFDFKKSEKLYKENLIKAFEYNDSLLISRTYNNLTYLYNLEKNDSAKYFLNEGLKYASNNNEVKARLYDNYADYHVRKNQFNLALANINYSLEFSLNSKVDKIPSPNQLNNSILKDYSLYCLKQKAETFLRLYQRDRQKEALKSALQNLEAAEHVVNLLLNGTTESSTQLIWRREASQAYLYGAYAAHLLGDKELAFSFMEKNKALLLSESVLKNTEFANLPKNVSDEETRLQKLMYELENKLSKEEDNTVLQDSLFIAKRTHENYVDSLKVVYPKYFDRKIDVAQVPLSEVQRELQQDQVLVSYIWNEFDDDNELLIGLATSKDKTITFEVTQTEALKEKLSQYRTLISSPQTTKENQVAYQKIAYKLYQDLFPTEEIKNLIKGKNLLIIPDGDLQNIPFESFTTKKNSNDYLILQSDVNYSYSYSFLKHNERVKRETNNAFVGYSPVTFKNDELSTLGNSKQELENISKELGGISKLQKEASKEDFLKQSSESKIIHLATHADAGEHPWIAFSDEKLELHELYTYKNNAELVTLSACNTSLGEMAKGEGVLSLARGFFHSGSKSVVSSLWNVNDTSTSDIMTDFYRNLREGQTKSEALNNAKRSYLTTHSLSEQSPYYWSSFVLIGDAEAIYASSNYIYYILGAVLLCILFIFFRKKRFS